ncbi:hypothetical protein D9M69_529230 [compost metagenome]
MRVVNWVHSNTANVWTLAAPDRTTGLTVIDVAVLWVGHCANRSHACTGNQTLFAGVQTQDSHTLVTTNELCICTSRTSNLTALAWLHLHVVDDGTNWHGRKRHCVTWLNVDGLARNDLVAGCQTLRSQNVAQLAVFVADQRDKRGAVWIVFQTFNRCDNVMLATLEVDETVRTLVTAALKANSDTTGVVTATLLGQTFGQ